MNRFTYQQSVATGAPMPCSQEDFERLLDSPEVSAICQQIAELDPHAPQFEDKKGALKRRLPIIMPHAASFAGTRRLSSEATPSGLIMIDVDHLANPADVFTLQVEPFTDEQRIYFAAITPSGHGLRLIAERNIGESIEAAQLRISGACGFDEIDAVTKDLARASYMMPRSYVLFYDPEFLFTYPTVEAAQCWSVAPATIETELTESQEETTEESALPTEYKGILYSSLVDQLLILTGNAGGALRGERNTVFYAMASYMRYVCDFNADLLLAALPDFGLSLQERKATIKSALGKPRRTEMPVTLQSAIALCQQQQLQDDKNELKSRACDLPLPRLPHLLSVVCRRLPEAYRPAMVIASLPVIGALATRTRFRYLDGQVHSPSFFSCITAPCASGKSFIRKPVELLLTPINEQDVIERQKEQTYKEKLRASKNAKNQPEDPHACPRNNGVNVSVAKLLELLTYAEGRHLIGICEEMDSLIKSERAGVWSEKSDIYRLAFDNAEYSQAYRSDNSFSAKVKVYYNLMLTGTPRSMNRFFKDDTIENGLMTRTCFAQLPDTSYATMPHFDDYTAKEQAEIIRWARYLDQQSGTIQCPQVDKAIDQWQEEKRQRAIDADSHAADIIRRRSAVIGFRAGMLCYLMEEHTSKKTVSEFAVWVAEYTFRSQMEMFGDKLENEISSGLEQSTERGEAAALIDLLPREFETRDLIALKAQRGQSVKPNVVSMLLKRWRDTNRIEKLSDGHFRKL